MTETVEEKEKISKTGEDIIDKKVTDEDLTNALNKPEIEVSVEKETETQLPVDQEERTKLGRHLKRLEDRLNSFDQRMENMLSVFEERLPRVKNNDDEMPEVVTTPQDVEKVLTIRERKQLEAQRNYESQYKGVIRELSKNYPDLHE